MFTQQAVFHRLGSQHGVGAGAVQGHRVEAGKHADVRHDGGVVLPVTVAEGGNIHHQADVEVGTSVADRHGVLCHLAVQQGVGVVVGGVDGVKVAPADAAAAALAQVLVDDRLAGIIADGVGTAFLGALLAVAAQAFLHHRLAGLVLFHLAGAGTAAHAQVLQRAAEAGGLMALEVVQGDDDVRIHDGPADLGGGAVFGVGHRHLDVVGATQAVADDELAAGGHGTEAVLLSGSQVFQGVLAPAGVQGVAVGEEGHAALFLHHIRHRLGPVGAQVRQVARLTEVDLDGHELAVHVDLADAGRLDELFQFFLQIGARTHPEVCIIHGRFFHH